MNQSRTDATRRTDLWLLAVVVVLVLLAGSQLLGFVQSSLGELELGPTTTTTQPSP